MKRKILIPLAALVLLAGMYLIGSGFINLTSAYISDFTLSEDGTSMEIHICVASSAGSVRQVTVRQHQGGKIYLAGIQPSAA